MLAYVLSAIIVQPGQTLSGIAANHGAGLAAVERSNPQIENPDMIYVGEKVYVPGGSYSSWSPSQSHHSQPAQSSASSSVASPSSVPTGTSGYQSCVIQHESSGNSQVMNGSGHYGLYQFDYSTWVAGGGSGSDVAPAATDFDPSCAVPSLQS